MREAEIQNEIRLALGRDPRIILWRNNVGVLKDDKGRRVRFGLCVGSSDLIGILRESGRFVALEVKTETGDVEPEQHDFINLVRRCNGFAAVVRSVEDAQDAITRACDGESQ